MSHQFRCAICRKIVQGMLSRTGDERTGFICHECAGQRYSRDGDIDDLLESRDDLEEVFERLILLTPTATASGSRRWNERA